MNPYEMIPIDPNSMTNSEIGIGVVDIPPPYNDYMSDRPTLYSIYISNEIGSGTDVLLGRENLRPYAKSGVYTSSRPIDPDSNMPIEFGVDEEGLYMTNIAGEGNSLLVGREDNRLYALNGESQSGQYYYDYDNLPPGKRIEEEFKPRNNELGVYGFNSYRTFIRYFHNEDATGIDGSPNEDEIP